MDSYPRDRRLCLDLRRVRCGHVTCKVRTVWEHSPTRRKENPLARINRGVNSPINCHYPLLLPNMHVAPHTGAQVAEWPPCHLAAPALCASCAGHPGAATWPQCRVATQVGPACHVSCRVATSAPTSNKTSFFAILLIENPNKNQIKFKKIHKTSEIHISRNTTPF